MGTRCPQHLCGPIGMAHARPQQLLGQGTTSVPIMPLLSLGHVWGGETPSEGWQIPQVLPVARILHSPRSPPTPHAAVLCHNGPFLPC